MTQPHIAEAFPLVVKCTSHWEKWLENLELVNVYGPMTGAHAVALEAHNSCQTLTSLTISHIAARFYSSQSTPMIVHSLLTYQASEIGKDHSPAPVLSG